MNKVKIALAVLGIVFAFQASSQVAINTSGNLPESTSILDVSSTTLGVLLPRMTAQNRNDITDPATGLIVYVTDDNQFYYFDGTAWVLLKGIDGLWLTDANADSLYPANSNVSRTVLEYNSVGTEQKLTIVKAVNRNNASNYSGAVFVAKGDGPEYSNNVYFGKYGESFYIPGWGGNGVMSTDQDMVIASIGQDNNGNPNLNPDPKIVFQVGGYYNYNAVDSLAYSITRMTLDTNGLKFRTGARINAFLDEDDFASDADTALATQQSIKAYVDNYIPASMVSTIHLWQGSEYVMSNTSGQDLSNCESGLIPTVYASDGAIDVKLVIRLTSSTAATNNFQLGTYVGSSSESFPIVNTDTWTWTASHTGWVVESEWKSYAAGTTPMEVHLYGWNSGGDTKFNSVYLLVRPHQN
jgi:hypothetical protein